MRPLYILLFVLIGMPFALQAQEEEATEAIVDKPERPAFESNFLIDNPTDKIYLKNTLEAVMQHRFGTISGGENDLAGIWGAANIRLGLSYTIHERLQLGFGTEKLGRYQDFNWKVGLLRQSRSGKMPVNVTYYGNWVIDASPKKDFNLEQDRYSFFHMLIISRRFSPNFSMQVAPSISHFNAVKEGADNDVFGVALGGRYKVTPNTAITLDWSMPLTNWDESGTDAWLNPVNGFSVGMEFVTSSHAFQVYLSNLNGITPQANYFGFPDPTTNYSFLDGFDSILLGFTITRLYNF